MKFVATRCHILKAKIHQIRFFAGASPQMPLGKLTMLPRPHSWIQGVLLLTVGRGQSKMGRDRRGGKRDWTGGKNKNERETRRGGKEERRGDKRERRRPWLASELGGRLPPGA